MKFKAILVDDENLAVQRLQRLLAPHADLVEIIGSANNGFEAVEQIDSLQPDLVFLDIQMPELNGFEVIDRLEYLPIIIFVTAYEEYALKAFETNSIDYLLKPIDPDRLQYALEKLRRFQKISSAQTQDLVRGQIDVLLAAVNSPPLKRLQVRIGDRIRLIDVQQICFFRTADKYVDVHTEKETFLISESLNTLETKLPRDDFVRIHRSTIINLNYLSEIVRGMAGHYRVRMRNAAKTILPVSRASKGKLGL